MWPLIKNKICTRNIFWWKGKMYICHKHHHHHHHWNQKVKVNKRTKKKSERKKEICILSHISHQHYHFQNASIENLMNPIHSAKQSIKPRHKSKCKCGKPNFKSIFNPLLDLSSLSLSLRPLKVVFDDDRQEMKCWKKIMLCKQTYKELVL